MDAVRITHVFGLAHEAVPDPVSGTPMVVARGRHHAAGDRRIASEA